MNSSSKWCRAGLVALMLSLNACASTDFGRLLKAVDNTVQVLTQPEKQTKDGAVKEKRSDKEKAGLVVHGLLSAFKNEDSKERSKSDQSEREEHEEGSEGDGDS